MKQIILALLLFQFPFSKTISQEIRQLADFNAVAAATGVRVILVKSSETKAKLELENCESEDIVTAVKGNELIVKFQNHSWSRSKNRKATITVYYKNVERAEVSSGAKISADNIVSAQDLTLSGSSGGIMDLNVNAQRLEVDVSSGGILTIEGNSDFLEVNVSSGGMFKSFALASKEAEVDASSGGTASFSVSNRLQADASSGGVIRYKGDPEKLYTNSSSAGSVRAKE
jgi:hypothetical protein